MSATIIKFRPKQKPPRPVQDVPDVLIFTLWNKTTGVQVQAVDEAGAAAKLCISVDEFRAQNPLPKVDGSDQPFYSIDDVARVMWERGIPVGEIVRGRR